MKEKSRAKLFVMIQQRVKKRAKIALKEKEAKEICDTADDLIEDTYAGVEPSNKECRECLIILKELM